MKIIDKIEAAVREGRALHSFEYFPPKTEAGMENLHLRIERMGRLHPAFIDITWGAGGSTAEASLELAANAQNVSGLETMLHLTCTNMARDDLARVLEQARQSGVQNILALRGDPPKGAERWEARDDGFAHAIDLVRFIRELHGDYFGICVAGYTRGHEEAASLEDDVRFLKEKVEAGADFVITQLFYEARSYLSFVERCRAAGVACPIVPGIMPIQNYRSFQRVTRYMRAVPEALAREVETRQSDDEAVRAFGCEYVVSLCRELLAGGAPGLHFYTLNLERVVRTILGALGLVPERVSRELPWRRSASALREQEDVRPIFWANRPASYLARTMEWDEFPNGRWGDARSPAFGELTTYHLTKLSIGSAERRRMWGEAPERLEDVFGVFVRFCRGEVEALPWYDQPLALESGRIRDALVWLNRSGLLTINSQPRVDGAPSDDPAVGWGRPGGRVYQKAYVEFFVSDTRIESLVAALDAHPQVTYHAVNRAGRSFSNCDSVNAVTWGVFPGQEIMQPTVVDPASFMVWKDEAFSLWRTMWGSLYPEDSPSRRLIEHIHDHFYLVNVVDNDYQHGDLFGLLEGATLASAPVGVLPAVG